MIMGSGFSKYDRGKTILLMLHGDGCFNKQCKYHKKHWQNMRQM